MEIANVIGQANKEIASISTPTEQSVDTQNPRVRDSVAKIGETMDKWYPELAKLHYVPEPFQKAMTRALRALQNLRRDYNLGSPSRADSAREYTTEAKAATTLCKQK